jgi:hypothetical protein
VLNGPARLSVFLIVLLCLALASAPASAQTDFTGQWAPLYHEDTIERIPGPELADYTGLPLNEAGRLHAETWDADRISVVQEYQCRPHSSDYALRGLAPMRISADYDPKTQRIVAFQIYTGAYTAQWEGVARGPGPPDFTPIALNPREGTQGRSLEVLTTNLRPGYLRRNGVPYSARTTLREYFALSKEHNGDIWFVVTTIVEDPEYLTTPFVTSTNFRKQADAAGWNPTPCTAR